MLFSAELEEPCELNRNETKVIKIKIIPDTEVCDPNKPIRYTYEWKILTFLIQPQFIQGNL